jgi:hypothetical protein
MLSWQKILDVLGVQEEAVQKKSGLSRRSFLKAMGAAAITVAAPPLLLPKKEIVAAPTDRLVTPNLKLDVDELRTWVKDIRQILSDNVLKEICEAEGSKWKIEAIDAVNDFTRMKLREDGFYRRIMPPVQIEQYSFAEPKFIGKSYILEDSTVFIDREGAVDMKITFAPATPRLYYHQYDSKVDKTEAITAAQKRTKAASNDGERRFAWSFWSIFKGKQNVSA